MSNFSKQNHLPPEVKILLVQGQTLVDQAKEAMNDRSYRFDLTSKWELKSDCRQVEKYIQTIYDGKVNDKTIKGLETSITKLDTILKGLINFFTR